LNRNKSCGKINLIFELWPTPQNQGAVGRNLTDRFFVIDFRIPMTKLKAVLFDFDGVLTTDKTGSLTTCKYLSNVTGINSHDISSAYKLFNNDLLLGKTTHSQIWNLFCDILGKQINDNLLIEAFKSTPLNQPMIDIANSLKNKGLFLGIITDNKKDRIDFLREYHKLDNIFNCITVSADFGVDKSSQDIFIIASNKLNTSPENCLYIDNQPKNLTIPKDIGMKTYFHDDSINDINLLKNQLYFYGI